MPKQQAGRNRKDWEDVESFLRGQLPGFQWEQALPEPSIHRVVSGFSHRNTKFVDLIVPKLKTVEVQQRLKKLIKKVRRRRSKAPELVTNNDNVCTLSFAATTSTRDIARLVAVVILRYLYFCGRMWVVTMRDFGSAWLDPVAVYLHLVEAVLEQNYVRFFDDDGKTTLLGTVDLISGLPLTHGSLAGSSGKVTYLAHEQHGLRASLFRGDETDDDLYGNHGHEAFAVNVTRGSWRYPTLVAHIRSRQEPLQKLADSLAKVGILPKVTLPEFQPSKQMRELWMNNRVDPLEAVSRDPALPERLCRGLEAARREVKELADARRRQQAEAAEQANANGRRLMSGACDTCATALRMDGICASCKSDARRLDRYAERASSRQSVRPGLSGQVNVGFGIGVSAPASETYFSFTCCRFHRQRERGWSEGDADSPVCGSCVSQARECRISKQAHLLRVRRKAESSLVHRTGSRRDVVRAMLGTTVCLSFLLIGGLGLVVPHRRTGQLCPLLPDLSPEPGTRRVWLPTAGGLVSVSRLRHDIQRLEAMAWSQESRPSLCEAQCLLASRHQRLHALDCRAGRDPPFPSSSFSDPTSSQARDRQAC